MSNLQISTTLSGLSDQANNRIGQINDAATNLYTNEVSVTRALGDTGAVAIGVILTKNYIKHMRSAIKDVATVQAQAVEKLANTKGLNPATKTELTRIQQKMKKSLKALNDPKTGAVSRGRHIRTLVNLSAQVEKAVEGLNIKIEKAGGKALATCKGCADLLNGRGAMNLPSVVNKGHPILKSAAEKLNLSRHYNGLKSVFDAASKAKPDGRFSTFWNRAKSGVRGLAGPAMVVLAVTDAAVSVVQEKFDPKQKTQIEKLSELMNTSTGDKAYNPVSLEERQRLIEWALAHTDDPAERAVLEGIKNNGYDVRKYLESTGQIKQRINIKEDEDEDDGPITKAWIQQNDDNITNGINAQFFGALAEKVKLLENQSENTSGDELATGDLQPISATPKSEQEVLEQELADTAARLQKWDQENEGLESIIQKYLNNDKLTEEEKAKIKPFINDYEKLQMLQKKLNDLDGGNKEKSEGKSAQAEDTHSASKGKAVQGTVPTLTQPVVASTPIARTGAQSALSSEEEKKKKEMANLPPEAIVQQPEEESFWTWKNILLILAAVGTLGIGAYFIIKYKKKADDAKKETSSLQSTVNDLQSQVNDLQGNTDSTNGTTPSIDEGLTKSASLANVATNITNTSLGSTNTILSGNDNTRV